MSIVNVQTKRGNYEGLLKALEDREEKPTDDIAEWQTWRNEQANLGETDTNKLSFDYFMKNVKTKPASVSITMPPGEKAWDVEMGKKFATEYITVSKEAIGAAGNLNRLDVLKKALDEGYQGKLAGLGSALGAYYEAITGNKIKGASETQIAQAISNRVALLMVGAQVEGGGMPANLFTEADREFIINANVNPKLTPEANERLLKLAMKTERVKIRYAQAWDEYLQKNKVPDVGIYPYIKEQLTKEFVDETAGESKEEGKTDFDKIAGEVGSKMSTMAGEAFGRGMSLSEALQWADANKETLLENHNIQNAPFKNIIRKKYMEEKKK